MAKAKVRLDIEKEYIDTLREIGDRIGLTHPSHVVQVLITLYAADILENWPAPLKQRLQQEQTQQDTNPSAFAPAAASPKRPAAQAQAQPAKNPTQIFLEPLDM